MSLTIFNSYAGFDGGFSLKGYAWYREYVRKGTAIATQHYTEAQVLMASGVPKLYDPYGPTDLGARCYSTRATRDPASQRVWRLVAKYKTLTANPKEQEKNPLARPAIWRYASIRGTRTMDKDRDGKVFRNTAGGEFRDVPEIVYSTSRYTVTRNELSFRANVAENVSNATNDGNWFGRKAGTVLCEGMQAEERYEGDYHYWVVTYVLHYDKYGWRPTEVLNTGKVVKDAQGKSTAPETDDGTIHGTYVMLNAAGRETSTPYYEKFNLYDEADFGVMAL